MQPTYKKYLRARSNENDHHTIPYCLALSSVNVLLINCLTMCNEVIILINDTLQLMSGDQNQPFFNELHLLMYLSKICLQTLIADRTLANLQLCLRVVVYVVDAHLIRDCKSSDSDIGAAGGVVPTSCDQCISLLLHELKL